MPVNWNATVVAKDDDRGRLITAGRGGEIRTVITSKRVAERTRPGQRLKVRVQRLAARDAATTAGCNLTLYRAPTKRLTAQPRG